MVVYLGGDISYLVDHSLYTPRFGDVYFAAPGEFHGTHLQTESVYNRYVLWFPADLLDDYMGGREAIAPLLDRQTPGLHNLLRPDTLEVPGLLALLREAEAALASEPVNELIAWSALLRFFHRIGCLCADSTPAAIPTASLSPILETALAYISAEFASIHSVGEIAAYVHVSGEHLSRLFTQHFGIPVSEYLRRYRLNESKRLLLGSASVTEACYSVGFVNMSHFIRCFRAYIGMTPAKYRAMGGDAAGQGRSLPAQVGLRNRRACPCDEA